VINGPRAVVIQIQTGGFTDAAAWSWLVPPGARLTLLDEAHAKPGYIWVLDVPTAKNSCGQVAYTTFSADPFTIVLNGPAGGGDYRMTLKRWSLAARTRRHRLLIRLQRLSCEQALPDWNRCAESLKWHFRP